VAPYYASLSHYWLDFAARLGVARLTCLSAFEALLLLANGSSSIILFLGICFVRVRCQSACSRCYFDTTVSRRPPRARTSLAFDSLISSSGCCSIVCLLHSLLASASHRHAVFVTLITLCRQYCTMATEEDKKKIGLCLQSSSRRLVGNPLFVFCMCPQQGSKVDRFYLLSCCCCPLTPESPLLSQAL
jgi:hypothetical protein